MRKSLSLRTAVTAVTVLTLAAGKLRAQTLDTTFAVRGTARLSVQNQSGSVIVRQWNKSQIRVHAEYDRAHLEFQTSPSQVSVRTESRRGDQEVEYTITVPVGTAVDVNGLSVDVTVTGVCGPLTTNMVSGDVEAQCVDGETTIQTVSGDISVADVRGSLEINATSGDVEVRGARGSVSVHDVSGDVTLADIGNPEVDVETVNGDVEYTGRIMDGGRYRFAAHSGDVTVNVQGNLNAAFTVSTFSGDFESDYQITLTPGRTMSGKEMEFQIGNGSARVRLNSFSGTISLRNGAGGHHEE